MNGKSQLDRFKEAAKELECDEDEKRFDAIVKKIAKSKEAKTKGGVDE